jgi:hypothetical protein
MPHPKAQPLPPASEKQLHKQMDPTARGVHVRNVASLPVAVLIAENTARINVKIATNKIVRVAIANIH